MATKRLVYGVGVNDYEGGVKANGKAIKSYRTWSNLLKRCYSQTYQERKPSYKGCSVCKEWLYFSNFKKWFDENYRFDLEEKGVRLDLDKDLLSGKSKVYSPDTCIFLPHRINTFITNKYNTNTSGYIGVHRHKSSNKWESQTSDFNTNKNKYLGLFTNPEEASQAYVNARKIEAEKAKQYLRELGYTEDVVSKIS